MGLVKRGATWWMSFMYQGKQVRRSTETTDKRLAEAILGKIKVQIVEGRFFEKPTEQHRTFTELLDRYIKEHTARRGNYYRELTSVRTLKGFFGNPTLDQVSPSALWLIRINAIPTGSSPRPSTENLPR